MRYGKAFVGVASAPGLSFGMCLSLIEERIFSVTETPLGPNLCLLEESVEDELNVILEDGGGWKGKWFKEVRPWKLADVECFRASSLSLYGITCYVRIARFLEVLLSDIGTIVNLDFLNNILERLDVINCMVLQTL